MPSFDVVSEVDKQELVNAVDQANREISNRYDFKGTDARIEQVDSRLAVYADNEFQVGQAVDVLRNKLAKRSIDLACLEFGETEEIGGGKARQYITICEGIDRELAKKITRLVKDQKLKVQVSIQGEQLRVTGKKRDNLQDVISLLRGDDFGIPLQYVNFRD
jgi:uncharacterized protein YajQ (UPF0234 family)